MSLLYLVIHFLTWVCMQRISLCKSNIIEKNHCNYYLKWRWCGMQKYKFKWRSSFHVSFPSQVKMYSTIWPAPRVLVFVALLTKRCSANAKDLALNPIEVSKIVLRLICKILFTLGCVLCFCCEEVQLLLKYWKNQSKNMTRTASLKFSSQPCLFSPCVSAVTIRLDEESSESYSSAFFFRLQGK